MSPIKRKVATRKSASRAGKPGRAKPQPHVALLVGTRKGAFIYHGDPSRTNWTLDGPHFLGHIVNHFVLDPRDKRTMLIASKTGHLGPTIFRSLHMGRAWEEANKPPAFGAMPEEWGQRSVDYTFHLTPGHPSEPNSWWAGTSPPGLFRSNDGGMTWAEVEGFNRHPMFPKWGAFGVGTPDGSMLQWITIDPVPHHRRARPHPPSLPVLRHVSRWRVALVAGVDWSHANDSARESQRIHPDVEADRVRFEQWRGKKTKLHRDNLVSP